MHSDTSKAFVDFVLDQLAPLGDVRARRMFGGTGLYCDDAFFAIVFNGVLYLKVDERSRPMFTRRGMKPFKPFADRPTTLQYYEVPAEVLEDADELCRWARPAALRERE